MHPALSKLLFFFFFFLAMTASEEKKEGRKHLHRRSDLHCSICGTRNIYRRNAGSRSFSGEATSKKETTEDYKLFSRKCVHVYLWEGGVVIFYF